MAGAWPPRGQAAAGREMRRRAGGPSLRRGMALHFTVAGSRSDTSGRHIVDTARGAQLLTAPSSTVRSLVLEIGVLASPASISYPV